MGGSSPPPSAYSQGRGEGAILNPTKSRSTFVVGSAKILKGGGGGVQCEILKIQA